MSLCRGKLKHATRDDADRHITELLAASRDKQRDRYLMPYLCGDHWHVGHYRPTLQRRRFQHRMYTA